MKRLEIDSSSSAVCQKILSDRKKRKDKAAAKWKEKSLTTERERKRNKERIKWAGEISVNKAVKS